MNGCKTTWTFRKTNNVWTNEKSNVQPGVYPDKQLAKKSKHILFLKIDNDGFDLGAQRREHDKNDLPLALKTLETFKECLSTDKTFDEFPSLATLVEREAVLENKDIVLSGERYKGDENNKGVSYKTSKLSDVATLEYGFTETAKEKGEVRFIRITDISENGRLKSADKKYIELNKESEKYLLRKDDLLMARTGATYGKTMLFDEDYPAVFASFLIRINVNKEILLPKFYWCFAQTDFYWNQAKNLVSGGGQPQFNGNALKEIEIPFPLSPSSNK